LRSARVRLYFFTEVKKCFEIYLVNARHVKNVPGQLCILSTTARRLANLG
jgi:hypothetical protein